jgi:hypothetical protein
MSWGYGEQLQKRIMDDQAGVRDNSEYPTDCQAEIQIGGGQ